MFRTKTISGAVLAALGLALMSSVAFAQPAGDFRAPNAPPAPLGAPAGHGSQAQYDDSDAPRQAQNDQHARDLFCRRDAAARTGYVSPGQAAARAQTNGSVGGTVLGAAAGAAIGSASHNAGAGALIGAGAGLLAGTAIGQDNARHAAADVEQAYADAYYACMDEADGAPPPPRQRYAYDYDYYGPPPGDYYPPYPYYYGPAYYGPAYYGPSVSFGFGFGGSHGGHGGHGEFRGGSRHR